MYEPPAVMLAPGTLAGCMAVHDGVLNLLILAG
jgi:hypothetical protein